MHTLTAENQANLEEKAIICDGRGIAQLRRALPNSVHHQRAAASRAQARSAFQFCLNEVFFTVPTDRENIGLAADLAIFNIFLPAAAGLIHNSFIPLSTACALETRLDGHGYLSQNSNPSLSEGARVRLHIHSIHGLDAAWQLDVRGQFPHLDQRGIKGGAAAQVGQPLRGEEIHVVAAGR
jgi:hypothetical protein